MTVPALPKNASLFTRLRIALQAMNVLKNDAGNPIYGPLLTECLDMGAYVKRVEAMRKTEDGKRLLTRRPSLDGPALQLGQLEKLPPGTLGREFAEYFRVNQIQPFVTIFEIESDVDFVSKRHRETHDLMHVMTGYTTDTLGEMELQAFLFGNFRSPSAILVLVFASPLILKARTIAIGSYFRRLLAAYRRGRRSKDLFAVPYEDHWQTPVATLSAQYCASP